MPLHRGGRRNHDPQHPAPQYARDYKKTIATRFAETAREAGAANPEQLGEQLALLLDGASARTRVLNTDTFPTAAAIAVVLIDNAIPTAARGSIRSATVRVAGERQPGQASKTATRTALARAWLRPQRRSLVDVHERVVGQERGFAPAVDEPGNLPHHAKTAR